MITNCQMMGCDWQDLTWHEYTMRLWHWNERHGGNEAPKVDPSRARSILENASMH